MMYDKRQISVRVEQEELDRLHRVAEAEDRPLSRILRQALSDYCDRAEQSLGIETPG